MNKQYIVRLMPEEKAQLQDLVRKGRTQAYRIKHANILLAIDAGGPNWTDRQAADAYRCTHNTARNVRQRFVEHGRETALERKKSELQTQRPIFAPAQSMFLSINRGIEIIDVVDNWLQWCF